VSLKEIIAKNIRGYRKKEGLTQEVLAGKLNLHSNYLARVERLEENLTIDRLEAIAKVFKIAPNLLLIPNSFKD
jgi:transcriptional regulator with XRE-family HTH domain